MGKHIKRSMRSVELSYFECPECQHIFPIPRKIGRFREKGHIKDLWCPRCKEITKHYEHRSVDYEFKEDIT